MKKKALTEGWGFPGRANKAHYFLNFRSLCMKWAYHGSLEHSNDNSVDNCADCKKRLDALRKTNKETA